MAGVLGFEPRKCQIQSLVPYRLAIPQCFGTVYILPAQGCFVNAFFKKNETFCFFYFNEKRPVVLQVLNKTIDKSDSLKNSSQCHKEVPYDM